MGDHRLLEVRRLTKRFGGIAAVDGVSFDVPDNAIVGLIGPNGSGKSVTFNCITRLLPPDEGEVLFKRKSLKGLAPHEVSRRGIVRSFQMIRVFPRLTVLENLMVMAQRRELRENLWLALRRWTLQARETKTRERVLELLEYVGLRPWQAERAANLSFGQQKLLSFAGLLASNPEPDLILLDEIAAGVNPTMINTLLGYIRDYRSRGKTFLIIEHDMRVIMELCDVVYVLDHGRKIAEGTPAEIQRNEEVIDAYFGR